MNLIFGKQPLNAGKLEIVDMITETTGLKTQDVVLMIDAFSFFIRKLIIEQGSACVRGLGTFEINPFSFSLYDIRYHKIRFDSADRLKESIKTQTITKPVKQCVPFKEQFKIIAKMFGLSKADVQFVFKLYITLIPRMIRKYKEFRITRIGVLKTINIHTTSIAKKWNYDKQTYRIDFKLSDQFFREINKKTNQYSVHARLRQMLYLVGENRDIVRKVYKKNDCKKSEDSGK